LLSAIESELVSPLPSNSPAVSLTLASSIDLLLAVDF